MFLKMHVNMAAVMRPDALMDKPKTAITDSPDQIAGSRVLRLLALSLVAQRLDGVETGSLQRREQPGENACERAEQDSHDHRDGRDHR